MANYEEIVNEENEFGDKDLSRVRILELSSGNKAIFEASDPFGFWKVYFNRGKTPDILNGEFTDYYHARRTFDGWLEANNKKIVKTKETVGDFKKDK